MYRSFLLFLLLFVFPFVCCAEKAELLSVTDGDTIRVKYQGNSVLVRFIGVDAPESHENFRAHMISERTGHTLKEILDLGLRSTKFLQSKISRGEILDLEFDVEPHDRYGRLLAYVYTPEGEMLNSEVLKQGYAHLLTVPPNIHHVDQLRDAYKVGHDLKRGLWSFSPFQDGMYVEKKKRFSR